MTDTSVVEKIEESTKVAVPKLYKVMLHNDDVTTMEFVIVVLMRIFHKTALEAMEITQSIHVTGYGIAGSPYTKEIAEEKVHETTSLARANGFPLTVTAEEL